jgi:hypothetical protein
VHRARASTHWRVLGAILLPYMFDEVRGTEIV